MAVAMPPATRSQRRRMRGTANAQRGVVLCVEVAAAVAQGLLHGAEKEQQRKGRRTERAARKEEGGRDRIAVRSEQQQMR